MGLKKHGVVVGCEGCRYVSACGKDCFDVEVPISDSETTLAGTARLHCSVSPRSHTVKLVDWYDDHQRTLQPPQELSCRLSKALEVVAHQRICGNSAICPARVVELVRKAGAN